MEWEIAAKKAIYTCIHCAWKLENGGFLTYGFKISDNGTRPIAGHFVTAALLNPTLALSVLSVDRWIGWHSL
jgi:hypothetical protein